MPVKRGLDILPVVLDSDFICRNTQNDRRICINKELIKRGNFHEWLGSLTPGSRNSFVFISKLADTTGDGADKGS